MYSWCAGRHGRTSSFRAEAEGFENALIWLSAGSTIKDNVIMLTDSQSLVMRLQTAMVKASRVPRLENIKAKLQVTYIPGHAGIYYNEVADQLAGIAQPIREMKLYPEDVINRLKEKLDKEKDEFKT